MEEINSKNKDISIKNVVKDILECFGQDFFENYVEDEKCKIVDFWEDDNYAIGLKQEEKVVYISSWDYRYIDKKNKLFYVEFELIDKETLDSKQIVKALDGINSKGLIDEMKLFFNYG